MARILYFYQYFGTSKGGWSTRCYEFARRWVEQGHQVTVVTSAYDKSDLQHNRFINRLEIDGIRVIQLNIKLSNKHGFLFRIYTFLAYAMLSSWYALVVPCDVCLSSSGPLTVGVPGLVARLIRRKPLVFEVRDVWPEGAIQLRVLRNRLLIAAARWFEGLCYRKATRVVALSPGQAAWIEKDHTCRHLAVVENAADNELFREVADLPLDVPAGLQGKKWIVYTGTLGLMYDCAQILDMAAVLKRRGRDDLAVVMIGDGKERAELEARTEKEALENVHFLGQRAKREVMQWLGKANSALLIIRNVPVMTTISPNKLFDAFAAGIPTLNVTDGWIADLFDEHRCGLNVAMASAEALADAAIRLADDETLWRELGGNARRLGTDVYDRGLLAAKMLAQLTAAIGPTSPRASEEAQTKPAADH